GSSWDGLLTQRCVGRRSPRAMRRKTGRDPVRCLRNLRAGTSESGPARTTTMSDTSSCTVDFIPSFVDWEPPGPVVPGSKFRLVERIGRGGLGHVWSCTEAGTPGPSFPGQDLAIKFLVHPCFKEHPDLVDYFREEAELGLRIRHPYIAGTLMF